jgi:DNA-binding response OmpR family regulator
MATARVEESDRLVGLELGADDYVIKPYSPREVVARVRAVLRRSQGQPAAPEVVRAADVVVDKLRHKVTAGDKDVELTPMEFELLAVLAAQPGRVFTRAQLLEATQGDAFEGYERTIDAHVKNLRGKLEPDPRRPRYVLTVFGVGYRFAEE